MWRVPVCASSCGLCLFLHRYINYMKAGNKTGILEFILLGLSEDPELQPLLFGLFLSMYLVTVLGNLLIILIISSDSHLHTPMYFFLSNLSLVDICFSTTIVPKMLVNMQTQSKAISYMNCLTQVYFSMLFPVPVSYTHLTLPTTRTSCRSRWSPYH